MNSALSRSFLRTGGDAGPGSVHSVHSVSSVIQGLISTPQDFSTRRERGEHT